MNKKRPRVVVVVTEGCNWDMLDRWSAEGLLPSFERLKGSGAMGPLLSGQVPYEVPGVASITTGAAPGKHGWFSFWNAQNFGYEPQLVDATSLMVPHLWERPELSNVRFGLVNIHGTHPPRPINGWMVTYPMQQTVRASYPKELLKELSEQGIRCAHDVSIWYGGQVRSEFLAKVIDADTQRTEAALELWRRGADVLMVTLTAIERVCHFYWQELEQGSPFALRDTGIYRAYAAVDELLGRLLSLVDDHTTLIALSEQGFGPVRAYVSINEVLAKAGFLTTGAADYEVEFSQSRAFEAVQGTHGVNINLAGRQRDGMIAEQDYSRVREEVCQALRESINPHTGLKLFRNVFAREDVYAGAGVVHAPDIIVEPADERYLPLGDPRWARHVRRTWQSGWHRRQSYFGVVGPQVSVGRKIELAAPVDAAATAVHALGLDVPREFDGQVRS